MKKLIAALLAWVAVAAQAAPTTIGFEDLNNLDFLASQYAGLGFSGGSALASGAVGGDLNEIDFPPHGGVVVGFSDSALRIDFTSAISQFSGYFTYTGGLRLSAFDGAGNLLRTVDAAFDNNTATGGDTGSFANELLSFSASDIRSIVIETLSTQGGAFVFDDLSFDTAPIVNGLPEPAGMSLGALATLAAVTASRRRRRH